MQTTTRPIRTGRRAAIVLHVELTPIPRRPREYRVSLAGRREAQDLGVITVSADETGWDWAEYPPDPMPECVMAQVMRTINGWFQRPNG